MLGREEAEIHSCKTGADHICPREDTPIFPRKESKFSNPKFFSI